MAKFGLFELTGTSPLQEYEGDYMLHTGEYVTIYKDRGPGKSDRQVGAIRLAPGQSVREIQ